MKELAQFDHWDIFAWKPLVTILENDLEHAAWFSFPVPDYAKLYQLAKLRLMRGFRTKEMLSALAETRQLARLVYSNELLVASKVAVTILLLERSAYDHAVKTGLIRASEWKVPTRETLLRANRAVYGYTQLFVLGAPEDKTNEFLRDFAHPAGFCAALGEGAINALMIRSQAGHARFPLEVDMETQYARTMNLLNRPDNPCRLTYARALFAQPEAIVAWFDDSTLDWFQWAKWKVAKNIPWIRQWVAFSAESNMTPGYLAGQYEQYQLPGE